MGIYSDIYGTNTPTVDALELEILYDNLEEKYTISLEKAFHEEITLSELFKITHDMA